MCTRHAPIIAGTWWCFVKVLGAADKGADLHAPMSVWITLHMRQEYMGFCQDVLGVSAVAVLLRRRTSPEAAYQNARVWEARRVRTRLTSDSNEHAPQTKLVGVCNTSSIWDLPHLPRIRMRVHLGVHRATPAQTIESLPPSTLLAGVARCRWKSRSGNRSSRPARPRPTTGCRTAHASGSPTWYQTVCLAVSSPYPSPLWAALQ